MEFTFENLIATVTDLFGAGTEETNTTPRDGLHLLLKCREVTGMSKMVGRVNFREDIGSSILFLLEKLYFWNFCATSYKFKIKIF